MGADPQGDQIQLQHRSLDAQDDSLILHLIYAEHGYYPVRSPDSLGVCDHVVIDEAQDFGLVEIRALLNAVDQKRTVTIVGDIAQKIVMGRNFDSWEEVLRDAGFENTTPISLTVSYRSTQEIMELAGKLRGDGSTLPTNAQKLRVGVRFRALSRPTIRPRCLTSSPRWIRRGRRKTRIRCPPSS
jgi:hypothetical protein